MELIKDNYKAGISVALVSLPLSTALAIASGATPMHGIRTGIYGSAMGGLFGGSNYNILGPAGALVNNLSTLESQFGVDIIPMVALGAGIISFIVYLLKLE